jgi:tetratricopeptide (TPR) repeat protein
MGSECEARSSQEEITECIETCKILIQMCAKTEVRIVKAINEAYQVLKDPKKREAYDLTLLQAETSEYGRYYSGETRYRDPRTWYYAHLHQSYHPPRTPPEQKRQTSRRSSLPRIVQVFLFYATLFMAIVILFQLIFLPWMNGVAAAEARSWFEEGNRWMSEAEYQKAIESYQSAVMRLPGIMEGWRAKGLAELRKAEELSIRGMGVQSEPYYRSAVQSFMRAYPSFSDDPQVLSGIGKALYALGNEKESIPYLKESLRIQPGDPTVSVILDQAMRKSNSKGG